MECYYHPDRKSTDICAICGKSICKECGLEIAGKIYCKECLEKIVGLGVENKTEPAPNSVHTKDSVKTESVRLDKHPHDVDENIYKPQTEPETYAPQEKIAPVQETRQVHDDSPYNIRANTEYGISREVSHKPASEPIRQIDEPQITQNEFDITQKPQSNPQEFVYPDKSYKQDSSPAKPDLENKYEKYLDDLYFDENEVPLGEQLAKDEEQYGSLTRRPYPPRSQEAILRENAGKTPGTPETPKEMEARIRAEILAESQGKKVKDKNIHNLNYQEEKEPMDIIDIALTVILIIVILIVIYYLIYVFVLTTAYPTFMDAIYGLSNPQNVINNILSPPPAQ